MASLADEMVLREELEDRQRAHDVQRLQEALDSWDTFTDYDRCETFDGTGRFRQWTKLGLGYGVNGACDLAYTTEEQLAEIRNRSRHLITYNEFAISAIENRKSYVVGKGHKYTVTPKPDEKVDSAVINAVNAFIEDWVKANRWQKRQLENQQRWDRDGDVLLRKFKGGEDGIMRVRYVEPERLRNPSGNTDEATRFGITFKPDDAETPLLYHVYPSATATEPDPIDASQIQHRKANVDMTSPRGLPTMFPVWKNFQRAENVQRNMSTVAEIQTAIAMVRKHMKGTKTDVQTFVDDQADVKRTSTVTGVQKTYKEYRPGTIIDMGKNQEMEFPAAGIDSAKYIAILQSELRAAASRLVMPEFMLTADASNANYSSTLVAEGPAVKMFERLQADMIEHDLELIREAIEFAIESGQHDLPEDTLALVDIDAEGPPVQVRDALKDAQADKILLDAKILSKGTMAARHGLDPASEKEAIATEDEDETGFAGNPNKLPPPPPVPPSTSGVGDEPDPEAPADKE